MYGKYAQTLSANNIIIFLWLYIHQDYSISLFTPKKHPSCWLHKQWILIIKEKKWKSSFPMTWYNYRCWCIYLQEVILARRSRLTCITKNVISHISRVHSRQNLIIVFHCMNKLWKRKYQTESMWGYLMNISQSTFIRYRDKNTSYEMNKFFK